MKPLLVDVLRIMQTCNNLRSGIAFLDQAEQLEILTDLISTEMTQNLCPGTNPPTSGSVIVQVCLVPS